MGGIVCHIPANAIMAGATPPVQPANAADAVYLNEIIGFDAKLRECFSQTDIVHGIEDAGLGDKSCDILAKEIWTPQERQELWDMLNSLWAGYP